MRWAAASTAEITIASTRNDATISSGVGETITPNNESTNAITARAIRANSTRRYIDSEPRTARTRWRAAANEVITFSTLPNSAPRGACSPPR